MPPTLLFNEGWLLRLALDWHSRQQPCSKSRLAFCKGARWYSEGWLASPFLERNRSDSLKENYTRADGVIGHFDISPGKRSKIRLAKGATQFVVIEAKLGSKLSPNTKNAPDYDQAARNAACLAHVVGESGRCPDELSRVAFYVIAPKIRMEKGVFGDLVSKESIRNKVKDRVDAYEGEKDKWFDNTFLPVLARLSVCTVTWEDIIEEIEETEQTDFGGCFREYYAWCLKFARLAG